MTLVYINWGHYAGFQDILNCAIARAGCRIIVISDVPKTGVEYLPVSEFPIGEQMLNALEPHVGLWAAFSLARWHVLRQLAEREPDIFPVFCSDWDVMIFRNLAEAYAPFADCDYTVSIDGGMASAAYGVSNFAALDALCKLVEENITEKTLNDMEAWSRLTRTGAWKVGNLFETIGGSVFDHNMHCGGGRFAMDGPAKRVVYEDGYPYFISPDGTVAANTIHCWGTYKNRTGEVLRKCGIK